MYAITISPLAVPFDLAKHVTSLTMNTRTKKKRRHFRKKKDGGRAIRGSQTYHLLLASTIEERRIQHRFLP
jgi:hypothetical protein